MSGIILFSNSEIENALKTTRRQYFVGEIPFSQILSNISGETIEAGITSYKHYHFELPHYHERVTTYEYIVEGETKYYDITKGEEHRFSEGDFVVIKEHTIYAQKSVEGTKIVFFKNPAGNDKVLVETTKEVELWLSDWDYPFEQNLS